MVESSTPSTYANSKPLPPGMILGPDGKPCKICTSWRDWPLQKKTTSATDHEIKEMLIQQVEKSRSHVVSGGRLTLNGILSATNCRALVALVLEISGMDRSRIGAIAYYSGGGFGEIRVDTSVYVRFQKIGFSLGINLKYPSESGVQRPDETVRIQYFGPSYIKVTLVQDILWTSNRGSQISAQTTKLGRQCNTQPKLLATTMLYKSPHKQSEPSSTCHTTTSPDEISS
ncbi:hypothetical protein BC835DRAFT_1308994 [Cytidiella melzeri]|nr:hypothetical protein BC835DRAFT_1308994 [Cytidiella melzeri]